jgi:hypothetical protein
MSRIRRGSLYRYMNEFLSSLYGITTVFSMIKVRVEVYRETKFNCYGSQGEETPRTCYRKEIVRQYDGTFKVNVGGTFNPGI